MAVLRCFGIRRRRGRAFRVKKLTGPLLPCYAGGAQWRRHFWELRVKRLGVILKHKKMLGGLLESSSWTPWANEPIEVEPYERYISCGRRIYILEIVAAACTFRGAAPEIFSCEDPGGSSLSSCPIDGFDRELSKACRSSTHQSIDQVAQIRHGLRSFDNKDSLFEPVSSSAQVRRKRVSTDLSSKTDLTIIRSHDTN